MRYRYRRAGVGVAAIVGRRSNPGSERVGVALGMRVRVGLGVAVRVAVPVTFAGRATGDCGTYLR